MSGTNQLDLALAALNDGALPSSEEDFINLFCKAYLDHEANGLKDPRLKGRVTSSWAAPSSAPASPPATTTIFAMTTASAVGHVAMSGSVLLLNWSCESCGYPGKPWEGRATSPKR